MAHEDRSKPGRVARAFTTAASRAHLSSGLSPDLERRAAQRLGNVVLMLGMVMVAGFVIRRLAYSAGAPIWSEYMWMLEAATGGYAVLSFALYAYSRKSVHPARVLLAGLVLEVFICFDLAGLEELIFRLSEPPPRLSFITLVLLTFPLVVPSTFRRRAVTTGLCLLSLPSGYFIGRLVRGGPPFELWTLFMYMPTCVAGIVSVALARIVHGLNVQVERARRMGSYELVEQLGGGGMGEVWRARHDLLVRPAAVKLIRADTLGTDAAAAMARFEREAQATSVLRSPHTVQLYDFGTTDDGAFFYAMELLDGLDLGKFVDRHGPMPPGRVAYVLGQACRSLADAHQHGLVHRDIKPANLFLCRLGIEHDFVKVLDFGLVKAATQGDDDLQLSRANVATGTPAFMPPELALGQKIDGRTDLYSLGCVAFFLLTGRLPFEGRTAIEVAAKHVTAEPPKPSEVSELDVPPAFDALVLRCMAKQREDRPAAALALQQQLESLDLDPWTESDAARWWKTHAGDDL